MIIFIGTGYGVGTYVLSILKDEFFIGGGSDVGSYVLSIQKDDYFCRYWFWCRFLCTEYTRI